MTCSSACCDEVAHLRATASRLYVALRERQLGDLTTPWFRAKEVGLSYYLAWSWLFTGLSTTSASLLATLVSPRRAPSRRPIADLTTSARLGETPARSAPRSIEPLTSPLVCLEGEASPGKLSWGADIARGTERLAEEKAREPEGAAPARWLGFLSSFLTGEGPGAAAGRMAQLARTAGLLQSSAAAEPSVSRRAKHSLRRDVELRERESGAASQRSSFEGWRGPAEWVGPAGDAPAWSGSADWADTAPEAPEARLSSSSSAGAVFDDGTEAVEEEGEAAWEGAGEDRENAAGDVTMGARPASPVAPPPAMLSPLGRAREQGTEAPPEALPALGVSVKGPMQARQLQLRASSREGGKLAHKSEPLRV